MAEAMKTEWDRNRLKAHSTFHSALQRGQIVKPRACQDCGRQPIAFLLRAHHPDHLAPLDVEWLCSKCHGKRNFEAHFSRLFTPAEWSRLVTKAKREGVSLRALILGWCQQWIDGEKK